MRGEDRLAGLPPFLVGASAMVAAEVSMGLLLYSGQGLLRALTLLLATLLGALALGLWSAPRAGRDGVVDAVRRRWLLVLITYAVAAVTAGAWSVLGGLASATLSRGLALALLAGLPLYGSGAVLGGIGVSGPGGFIGASSWAAAGAATGAVLTGLLLVPNVVPASMYVICLVALSGGALVHGRVLDRIPDRRVVDEEASVFGTVRVTRLQWGRLRREQRILTVGGRLVGGTENGRALRPWERALAEWVVRPAAVAPRALLFGGATVVLQQRLREVGVRMVVVERNPVIRRMVVRHFGLPGVADDVQVVTGESLETTLEDLAFGTVVVDGAGTAWGDALALPSDRLLGRFRRALRPDGVLVLGGDDPSVLDREEAARDLGELLARNGFPRMAGFAWREGEGPGRAMIVAGGPEAALPEELLEMERVALPERAS